MKTMKKPKSIGSDLGAAMPTGQPVKEPDDIMDNYQAKDHLDTIIKAHNIQKDPDKMAKVHELAGRHMDAMKGISMPKSAISSTDDLRKLKNKAFAQKPDSDTDGE